MQQGTAGHCPARGSHSSQHPLPPSPGPGEPWSSPRVFPQSRPSLQAPGSSPQGLAFPPKAEAGEHAQPKGPRIPSLRAGGLFITLAPLQTDVSFYSELALNGSLVSSVSHGLKTEGERGGDTGESAGLALVPRPSVLAPHSDVLWRAHGWKFAGFCVEMLWSPLTRRGRVTVVRQGCVGLACPPHSSRG